MSAVLAISAHAPTPRPRRAARVHTLRLRSVPAASPRRSTPTPRRSRPRPRMSKRATFQGVTAPPGARWARHASGQRSRILAHIPVGPCSRMTRRTRTRERPWVIGFSPSPLPRRSVACVSTAAGHLGPRGLCRSPLSARPALSPCSAPFSASRPSLSNSRRYPSLSHVVARMFPGRFATHRPLAPTRLSLCPIRRSTMLSFPFTSLPNIPSFLSMHRCRIAIPRLPRCPTSAAVRLPCHRPPPLMCPLPRPRPAHEPRRITPTLICAVAFASSPAPGPSRPALRVPGRRLPCFSVSYPYTPLHSTLSLGLCMYFRCPYAVFLYCTYKGLFYSCLVGISPRHVLYRYYFFTNRRRPALAYPSLESINAATYISWSVPLPPPAPSSATP